MSDGKDHSECGHTAGTDRAHCVHSERSPDLIDAAFTEHDKNATALTEARKTLRHVQQELMPEWRGGKAAQAMARLNEVVDALNQRIIASRKLAKGELP